jgi:hypothetical protein
MSDITESEPTPPGSTPVTENPGLGLSRNPRSGDGGGDGQDAAGGGSALNRWRQRAIEAESKVLELEKQLGEAKASLEESQAALDSSERKRQIERELAESDAIDLEAASLLTEAAVEQMSKPDVAMAVADLRRRKPWLFRSGRQGGSGSMASAPDPATEQARLNDGLLKAARGGDRRALLRYLRSRRGA